MKKWQAAALVAALAGVAWAGGWDDAKHKADEAKHKADEVRTAYVESTKKVVTAMCQARDLEHLKETGRSEAGNVRSSVRDKLDRYHSAVKEAIDALDHLDSTDSHHGEANTLESELKSAREKLDSMTYKIVDGSPEFIDPVVRAAESAQSERLSLCSQRGFSADSERIACMIKESDTCYVVEIALENSSSQSNARDRARRGVDHIKSELKKSSPTREVNGCVKVEPRVDCMKVCPEVSSDGRVDNYVRASWHERCN